MQHPRQINTQPTDFEAFIKANLFVSEFESPETSALKWSKTRLTQSCNRPEDMRKEHIYKLAKLLWNDTAKAMWLHETFMCGKNTLRIADLEDMRALEDAGKKESAAA